MSTVMLHANLLAQTCFLDSRRLPFKPGHAVTLMLLLSLPLLLLLALLVLLMASMAERTNCSGDGSLGSAP